MCSSLEAVLHAILDHNSLSVEKFSRWLRAICTIILARNRSADRVKAIGYVEQAINVMENSSESDEVCTFTLYLMIPFCVVSKHLHLNQLILLPYWV